jgi:type IV pilus assembly protein PilM
MPIQPGVWGIDLGQCALKAIRLQEVDGEMIATAFDYVEHPKILSQPDADPDQLTREALEKFLSRNTLRGDIVAISVPGQSGLARFVKLPPVEEKKIADIVRFEAKQQIPFNLDEVVWDYQKIGSGDVSEGFAMGIEIGLFAMKRDMINRFMQHFKDVGVEIHHVQMAPLALCNFVSYDLLGKGARNKDEEEKKSNCVVALDIGADSSNLVITDADRIIWQRPIPLGGNHFTRALTKEMKLTFAKAEHLKRNAMKSPDLKKILTALKPVLNDFVGEVQRSLGYFTNTHRDAQIEYMVGLGNAFRLPGLQRYLGEKLALEVRKLGKLERLGGNDVLSQPTFSENVLTFGVAYGLALQGMKQARLLTNLLPHEIRMERLVRAKKPWAVAAAALLILGTSAMTLKAARETRVYTADEVTAATKEAEGAVSKVNTAESNFTRAKTAAAEEESSVRSIVAGQPEFKNWLELTTFISSCEPQPDGTNLPGGEQSPYWKDVLPGTRPVGTAMSGKAAFAKLKERLAGKTKDDSGTRDELGVGIDDLVQLNIQSVDARFTDDLASYWNAARKISPDPESVRPRVQADKPPEGKGWIIEIQGYTFHHKGPQFVRDTLMENLAAKGISIDAKSAAPTTPAAPASPVLPKPAAPPAASSIAPIPAAPGGIAPIPGAAAPGKDAGPNERDIPPTGPILNRIGHVLLFKFPFKPTNDMSNFEVLGQNYLIDLAKASPVTAQTGPGGFGGGPTAKTTDFGGGGFPGGGLGAAATPRDTWFPLGSFAAGSTQGGPMGGGAMRAPERGPMGTAGGTVPAETGPAHQRTEFIVLFIWKEPTPSAVARKEEEATAVPPSTGQGPGGARPGPAAPPPVAAPPATPKSLTDI